MGMHIEELRDLLCEELDKIAKKGELSAGMLETVDKLTHSIKSIDTIMAMEESGYSNDGGSYDGSYDGGPYEGSYGGSYARAGRGGRYSRNSYARGGNRGGGNRGGGGRSNRAYSRDDGKEQMIEQLEDMMEEAQDSKTREAIKRAIHQIGD